MVSGCRGAGHAPCGDAAERGTGGIARTAAGSPDPALSVLIACWNSEDTIEHAIASVLALGTIDLEVVVVDDGSTDRTVQIVRRMAREDARVRLEVLPRNIGASEARNRGLELVRGEWLTILDADDRFTPGGLAILAHRALASDAAAVVGQQFWTDGSNRWISGLYDNLDIRDPGRKSLATHPGLLYFVSPHAKLIRRSCWVGLQFSGPFLGDQPWVIRALLRAGDRIDVLREDVYEWHRPTGRDGRDTITTRARSSARTGVEAAKMARQAFEAVAAEAATRLEEPERRRLLSVYLERLLRYDLAPHVKQALDRRDPATADLLDAVTSFISDMPPELLVASAALGRDALEPPLLAWRKLDPPARAAFERLVAAVALVDPGATARVADWRHRFALAIGLGLPRSIGAPIAQAMLLATMLPSRGWRRVRARLSRRIARRSPERRPMIQGSP